MSVYRLKFSYLFLGPNQVHVDIKCEETKSFRCLILLKIQVPFQLSHKSVLSFFYPLLFVRVYKIILPLHDKRYFCNKLSSYTKSKNISEVNGFALKKRKEKEDDDL